MSWEALTAVGSSVSAFVIAVAAIAALIQIRAIRSSAHLQGFIEYGKRINSPEFLAARTFTKLELPARLEDPNFLNELRSGRFDRGAHKELLVGNFFQEIGMLVQFGSLETRLFLEEYRWSCPDAWKDLAPIVMAIRVRNPSVWEHFERFARQCEAYNAARANASGESNR